MQTKTVKMLIKRELTEKRQSLIWLSLLTALILFFTFPKQLLLRPICRMGMALFASYS